MTQNPCMLCGEHESLPNQEACAICANDAGYASKRFSDGATATEPEPSQEFSDEEPVGKLCADPDQFEGVDWDEEHRRAQESGEMQDEHEYSYY